MGKSEAIEELERHGHNVEHLKHPRKGSPRNGGPEKGSMEWIDYIMDNRIQQDAQRPSPRYTAEDLAAYRQYLLKKYGHTKEEEAA